MAFSPVTAREQSMGGEGSMGAVSKPTFVDSTHINHAYTTTHCETVYDYEYRVGERPGDDAWILPDSEKADREAHGGTACPH